MNQQNTSMGDRIRQERRRRGMSQAMLAHPDLSDSYISLIESGKRTPSVEVTTTLADRLGCTPTYLRSGVAEHTLAQLRSRAQDAQHLLTAGHADQVLPRLSELAADPEVAAFPRLHRQVRRDKAAALEALGRFDLAIKELQAILEAAHAAGELREEPGDGALLDWPTWGALQVAVARCHRDGGQESAAARAAEAAFLTAAHPAGAVSVARGQAAVRVGAMLAELYLRRGDVLLARQTATRLLELAVCSGDPGIQIAAYQQAAACAEAAGDTEQAALMAAGALQVLEDDPHLRAMDELRLQYAGLLLRARPEQADHARQLLLRRLTHATLTTAVDLVGSAHPQTLLDLARAELTLGRPEQAADRARQALQPGDRLPAHTREQALALLGHACLQLGDRAEAIAAYTRRAETIAPLGPCRLAGQAWLDLAEALAPDDHDRRVQAYQKALSALGLRTAAATGANYRGQPA